MSLLRLPAEILIQILDDAGTPFFREDIRRLTVCKYWFQCASTVCFKELVLARKFLRRLFSSHNAERSLLLVRQNLERLHIELKGSEPQIEAKALNKDLNRLAALVQSPSRLRAMHIYASSEPPRWQYIALSPLKTFLSMRNLTVLDLDLGTSPTSRDSRRDGDHPAHLCPNVGAMLDTLQRLRLRMSRICEIALKPRNQGEKLRLSEVYVNLNHANQRVPSTIGVHCGRAPRASSRSGTALQLQQDIEKQAQILVTQMSSPQKIRILTRSPPRYKLHSFDVLTGSRMVLFDRKGWEDDGKVIEKKDDSDSEPEMLS